MGKRLNTDWSIWYLINDVTRQGKPTISIRRNRKVDGKIVWDRKPHAEWSHLKQEDLPAYVARLNGEREQARKRAEEAYRIKHTFITQELLDEFDKHVRDESTTEELTNAVLTKVHRNFLHFFVNILKLNDPLDWKDAQATWGKALLNRPEKAEQRIFADREPRSKRVIDDNVAAANRFMNWIHEKNPRLFPLVHFSPVSKAVLRNYEAKRKMDNPNRPGIGKYVPTEDWLKIEREMSRELFPFVFLARKLGLRRAEALGPKPEDVRQGYFHLQRQLVAFTDSTPVYGPPKNRKDRKIEYWYTSPAELYETIDSLPSLMHPDTFTDRLTAEMRRLGLDYEMHDFRRSFITDALRDYPSVDVQRSAGHASIQTTMRYMMDDRDLSDRPFVPKKKGNAA